MKRSPNTSSNQSKRSSTSEFFNSSDSASGTFTPAMLELELVDYVSRGQSTLVEAFLEKANSISPDICEQVSKDPLICIAALQKDINTVKVLLKYGANADVLDSKGKTPMDYAKACPKLLELLVSEVPLVGTKKP